MILLFAEQSSFVACGKVSIKNGISKMRNRGKFIRYQCATGFELYGSRYASCSNGRWDSDIPICISI